MARQPRHQLSCQCCGLLFPAVKLSAKWCSNACRQWAYHRRQRNAPETRKASQATSLECRTWQGTPIERRPADGFVNATAMCQANGRRWAKYAETERCREYIAALKAEVRISDFAPVLSQRGGVDGGGQTWIHPSLAIDLARWISPAFAVWMDGWFLETVARQAPPPTQQLTLPTPEPLIGEPPAITDLVGSLRTIAADTAEAVQFELAILNTSTTPPLVRAVAEEFHATASRLRSLGVALAAVV
jgi:hypothetical protein